MIVVDTNIIAYFYLSGEHSHLAEALYRAHPAWASPLLWRSEFRNILALYLRQKILNLHETLEIMQNAENLLDGHEYTVESAGVLEFAHQSNCSTYDCEFVFLAKELNVPLITNDKKILKAFPRLAVSLMDFNESAELIN